MKIIRLTTFLDFGGIERKMENLSSWKDDNFWIFVSLSKGGDAEKKIRENKKTVYCLNLPYKIPSFRTIWKLYRLFRIEKPDIVHTAGAESNFHGILAAKLAKVPIKISEEIGTPKHSKMAKFVFRWIFHLSDYVVGESKFVISHLRDRYHIKEKKLLQIPNFIPDTANLPERTTLRSFFSMVSISRLEPIKNIRSILKTIPKLVDVYPDFHYTIVGDGIEKNQLSLLVDELKISNFVTFVGYQTNPYPFLLQSDLYILNSFSEGFSNSLLEAMSVATPSLSTKVGAADEYIIDGWNGWLIAPDNEEEQLKKLIEIIGLSLTEREKIGKRGQETVVNNYSLKNHMNKLTMIYKR